MLPAIPISRPVLIPELFRQPNIEIMSCSAALAPSALIDTLYKQGSSSRDIPYHTRRNQSQSYNSPYASNFRSTSPSSASDIDLEFSDEFSPENLTRAVSSSRPSRRSSFDTYLTRSDACIPVDTFQDNVWQSLWSEPEEDQSTPQVEQNVEDALWEAFGTRKPAVGSGWSYDYLNPVKPDMDGETQREDGDWEGVWETRQRNTALRRLQELYKHFSNHSPSEERNSVP